MFELLKTASLISEYVMVTVDSITYNHWINDIPIKQVEMLGKTVVVGPDTTLMLPSYWKYETTPM